jgi:hypothetical protein
MLKIPIESYPWWPAVVFEEDDDAVTEEVVAGRAAKWKDRCDKNIPGPLHVVRFFDKQHSW